jgi:uncharacterized protein YhaN
MKLLRLNLRAVGPFSSAVLDLSAGQHGLHLIYGPNEAGKTSALRAISHLLFGFPHLSADNFVHPNEQLRVGATLRHSDGGELEMLRRRGRGNTLRAGDDCTVIPEEWRRRFLGDLNQAAFESLFGIDHERLSQAGEEIRTGKGILGELLFAAGAGLAGLRRAQQSLQQGIDDLFKPRAQNPRINKVLTELEDAQKEWKRQQLTIEEWQQRDGAYRESLSDAERLREAIRKSRVEHGRLTRIKSAIPLITRRQQLAGELAKLGDFVRLRDSFGAEFRAAQDKRALAEHAIARARAAIAEIAASLRLLDTPRALLDAADQVEALQERLGAFEKASVDRANIENLQQTNEYAARRLLRELGRPTDLDQAESLRLRADEPAVIRGLGQKFAELRGQADEARRTIARHDEQIRTRETELSKLEQPAELDSLRRVVRQARKAGDLDTRLSQAREQLARAEKDATTALAQHNRWHGTAEELRQLAVPLDATLDQFERRFLELSRRRQTLAERLSNEKESIRERDSSLRSLTLEQDLPSEEAVLAARRRREDGWRLVQAAWLGGAKDGEECAAFLAEFARSGTLAEAYAQSVKHADVLADRLRREADRVARKAELEATLSRHRANGAELEHELKLLDDRQIALDTEWKTVVASVGIDAERWTPPELRAWLRRREEVVKVVEKAEHIREDMKVLEQALASHRGAVHRAFVPLSKRPNVDGLDLAESLDLAEELIKRQDELVQKRARLESTLAAARTEQAGARLSLQSAESELEAWRSDWSDKMERLGLEPSAAPAQAEVVLTTIAGLFQELESHRGLQKRIQGIDRDAERFAVEVRALATRVASDLESHPIAEQARELGSRLRVAQADAQKAEALLQQQKREESQLRAGQTRYEEARVCLERLCQEANCNEISELAEAEQRSQAGARLEKDLAAVVEELRVATAGDDPARFIEEVEQCDSDALDASIKELDTRIASLENEQRAVQEATGAAREALSRMSGGSLAAETAENIQTLIARLQSDVSRFATLKLAAAVLHRGIERYREQNQGPILMRASRLFAILTGGSFTGLQIDDDGNGHSIVKGLRPGGTLVGVEGMSDGTHDQLYLALRLASLESWLQSHEPIPFIVDDILLSFDDERAAAALCALAELSKKTQVLFFTHHQHLVDLARSKLPRDLIFTHELERSSAKGA